LRLREGFQLEEASQRAGIDARGVLRHELNSLSKLGLLQEQNGRVQLSPAAMSVADAVAARLLH